MAFEDWKICAEISFFGEDGSWQIREEDVKTRAVEKMLFKQGDFAVRTFNRDELDKTSRAFNPSPTTYFGKPMSLAHVGEKFGKDSEFYIKASFRKLNKFVALQNGRVLGIGKHDEVIDISRMNFVEQQNKKSKLIARIKEFIMRKALKLEKIN